MRINTSKTYTNEEIFEALKREFDFPGMYVYKALIGGATTRIPSHKGYGDAETGGDAYFDIMVYASKNKIDISVSQRIPLVIRQKIIEDFYPKQNNSNELMKKVASECIRLFP